MGFEPTSELGKLAVKIHKRLNWRHLADFEELLIGKTNGK
jgi:hypothetical protein